MPLAPEHSEQQSLGGGGGGGGGQAIHHKQCLPPPPPPQTFVSSERSGATDKCPEFLYNLDPNNLCIKALCAI